MEVIKGDTWSLDFRSSFGSPYSMGYIPQGPGFTVTWVIVRRAEESL